ncbi:MAG: hemerythrin domain-containing protein [Candidatus Omnitrophota bacterium]|jgi:hemerythrin-like domain-containing protein
MDNKPKAAVLPIGPLMIEHRLIERMVALLREENARIAGGAALDLGFIALAVDFFRFYADRCHHGKEEDFLFKDLQSKQLSEEHKKTLAALLEDHARARGMVAKIEAARLGYLQNKPGSIEDIKDSLDRLVQLYAGHIQKEDKQFFIPSMDYFTKEERDKMLAKFREFDAELIHGKYNKLVTGIEKGGLL